MRVREKELRRKLTASRKEIRRKLTASRRRLKKEDSEEPSFKIKYSISVVKVLSASDNRALKGYGFAYDLNAVKLVVQVNEGSVSWILGR